MPQNAESALQSISTLQVPIVILVTFILSLWIAWTYKKTHQGLSYSQSFVFTLVVLAVLSSITMLVIQGSLARAFTLLGAFTIIRFRTAVKDTKDTAFIFWTLVTGMAVGVNSYALAVIETVMISAMIFILARYKFGSLRNYDHVLTFFTTTDVADQSAHTELFKKYFSTSTLLNIASREGGKRFEFTYNVKFFNDSSSAKFIQELTRIPNISNPNLFTAKDDIEY